MDLSAIRLTETVTKGGCAAKLPAGQLRQFLAKLALPKPDQLAVGTETLDDACLWDLGNGQYLVQTLDFFTPIVDDPRDFGAIAAANALSDVFAMGGRPRIALTIMGFPASKLPLELIEPLMAGAVDKITEAGACLAGGHTIDDDLLKLGFAVTGFVDKNAAWTNAGAKPGDALILTKPLGTGVITSALKAKKCAPEWLTCAVASMKALNDTAGLLDGVDVHAATDVTGFGLGGHGLQMAQASGAAFEISLAAVPALPGALACLDAGVLNRAHRSNADYIAPHVDYGASSATQRWLAVDPQTSGGLLLAIPEPDAERAVAGLRAKFPATARIGTVTAARRDPVRLTFV
jgi:selenide,water dikinase